MELVLADIQRVTKYVRENEREFIENATKRNDTDAKKALAQSRKEYNKAEARVNELDTVFRKLYEYNALGKLSDQQFTLLTSGFETERAELKIKLTELMGEINSVTERGADVNKFVEIVRRYTDVQELTYENVHELIDRILIHETDHETNTRKVEIYYSFVNQIDIGGEPTSSIAYLAKERKNIKSIVT